MRLLVLPLLLGSAVASASGFYLSENGSKALLMGGAFAGQADDLSAIQHNPAGLAQLTGFNFLLDGQLVFHDINYQRYDPGFDPASPPNALANGVQNTGGPFVVPMLGAGFGFRLLDRTFFVGAGVYGPPADGHYQFPTPNYETDAMGRPVENARKFAPQRYSLVSNTIYVVYPSLSLAAEVIPKRFSLGVSLQPVIASFQFAQSVTSINILGITPSTQAQEDPAYDSLVRVNLPLQYVQFTGVFGAMVKATDWLQFGVSFRPQVMINARGTLEIEPGPFARQVATVQGNQTSLSLMLPAELKVGVHVQPLAKLGINFDFIYQGWQSVQEIVLHPEDVTLTLMGNTEKVQPFKIQKRWKAAYNFRLGASYAVFPWLSLYAGGWYETGAIPNEYIGVDFLHFERFVLTGGVGVKFFGLELVVGAAGSPAMTYAVTQSEVRAGTTQPEPPGPVVGAGVYTSGHYMVTAGIRGQFGGAKPASTPVEPAPTPAPAPVETAPAADPAPAPAAAEEAPKS
ncbi:MAG: outer membrane protein transport protein [Myxococcaceae bacterium]|nr:outer membrane protein transport protein [Myxococcaceae bacterium]